MRYILAVLFFYFLSAGSSDRNFYCYQHVLNCRRDGNGTIDQTKCYRSDVIRKVGKVITITTDSLSLRLIQVSRMTTKEIDRNQSQSSFFAAEVGNPDHLYYVTEVKSLDYFIFSANPTRFNKRGIVNAVQITYSNKPLTFLCP